MFPYGVTLWRLIDIWVFFIEQKDGWAYVSCLKKESFSWGDCRIKSWAWLRRPWGDTRCLRSGFDQMGQRYWFWCFVSNVKTLLYSYKELWMASLYQGCASAETLHPMPEKCLIFNGAWRLESASHIAPQNMENFHLSLLLCVWFSEAWICILPKLL